MVPCLFWFCLDIHVYKGIILIYFKIIPRTPYSTLETSILCWTILSLRLWNLRILPILWWGYREPQNYRRLGGWWDYCDIAYYLIGNILKISLWNLCIWPTDWSWICLGKLRTRTAYNYTWHLTAELYSKPMHITLGNTLDNQRQSDFGRGLW